MFRYQTATCLIVVFLSSLPSISASAQVQGNCQFVTNSSDRLSCYDRMFPPSKVGGAQKNIQALDLKSVDLNTLCKPKEIVERLKSFVPKKSEFETQAEFERRIRSSVSLDDVLSRDLICEVSRSHLIKYNAESQGYDVSTLGAFESHEEETGTYQATNAFGASVRVSKKDGWHWEIDGTYLGSVRIPMSKGEAERRQNRIRVAVVGKIRSPFYKEESYLSMPKFNSPEEVRRVTRTLFLASKTVIAFDASTGEVFWSSRLNMCKNDLNGNVKAQIGTCHFGYR
jgi:hypothetical protein